MRVVVWRLAFVALLASVVGGLALWAGQWLLDLVIGWLGDPRSGFPLDLRDWLADRGRIDVALAAVGLTFASGLRWALRSRPVSGLPSERIVFGAIPRQARWFQPRPVEQEALRKALGGKGRAALVALPGARGAGKSQLAAVQARTYINDGFDLVAWINAESGPISDLALLGDQLGLRTSPDQTPAQVAVLAIRAVSAADGRRRLLVFDNVEDPSSITAYLPVTGTAKVLITTNRQEVALMADVTAVELGMFTPQQGVAFLTSATGLPDSAEAAELGQMLGWLPLGLAQAAAYIKLNKLTYAQYMERLSRTNADEALMQQAGAAHRGVLQATQLSLVALEKEDPSGNAVKLLRMLSMLAPEGIRRDLLVHVPAVDHSLTALTNLTLVTLAQPSTADRVFVVVHRLTARIVRHFAADSDTYDEAIEDAAATILTLTEAFPRTQAALRRAEFEEIVSHVLTLRDLAQRFHTDVGRISRWTANALKDVGDFARAIAVHEAVVADSERALGSDHPNTLANRNHLAEAFWSAGRYDEAIVLHERTLADRERLLGSDHHNTLESRHNLAGSYWAAGRHNDAISLHERTLADGERILGPDHPDTLSTRNDLANAYLSAGRHNDAIPLHERTLADYERILGPDHLHTITSRLGLAAAYWAAGRYHDAIPLEESTVTDRERLLGPDHPSTLNSRHSLAVSYGSAGRHQDAIQLHEKTLADRERILGHDHPDTIASRNDLAAAYSAAGRHADARKLRGH